METFRVDYKNNVLNKSFKHNIEIKIPKTEKPNKETLESIKEYKTGKTNQADNVSEMFYKMGI